MLMAIFIGGIVLLMLLIIKLKINPFLALLFTSLVIGILAGLPVSKILSSISSGFGGTLGGIGIVIALGIILGELLYETGGTQEIANLALRKIGIKNSPLAMAITGVIVAIPVYFDAAFVILVNLARELAEKTGIPLVRFVTALAVGLIIGHCVIIPTPGPMAVAGAINVSLGYFVLYAVITAVPSALVGGVLFSKLTAKKFFPEQCGHERTDIDFSMDDKTKDEHCSGPLAIGLILFPIILILLGTIANTFLEPGTVLAEVCAFVGDKNVALFLGVVAALVLLRKYFKAPAEEMITAAASQSGMVLLITGAGGSFGAIINATGIGDYIVGTMQDFNVPLILLGFILSQILRAAQGSATVALVTTAAILAPSIAAVGASPVLVGLAICFGGVGLSLPNDSGFWVINRFSGFTFEQTMKSWTIGGFIAGLTGLVILIIMSLFQNVLPGLM